MTYQLSRHKRIAFAFFTGIVVWTVCELLLALGLSGESPPVQKLDAAALVASQRAEILRVIRGDSGFLAHSERLGWTVRPNGLGGIYRANAMGARADREYEARPPDGVLRVATYGDSFTLGEEAEIQDTWQAILEREVQGLEVLNFGVSAYGPDQAYLRYLDDGRRLGSNVIILGYISENAARVVNTFRPFYLPKSMPMAKPRFRLTVGGLELLPNPLPTPASYQQLLDDPEGTLRRIGRHDAFYQQYLPTRSRLVDNLPSLRAFRFWQSRLAPDHDTHSPVDDPTAIVLALCDAFQRQVLADGALPIFMLLPVRSELVRHGRDLPSSIAEVGRQLKARGYCTVEPLGSFAAAAREGGGVDPLFAAHGHYSAAGNHLVAEALRDVLAAKGLLPAPRAGSPSPAAD